MQALFERGQLRGWEPGKGASWNPLESSVSQVLPCSKLAHSPLYGPLFRTSQGKSYPLQTAIGEASTNPLGHGPVSHRKG